MKPYKHGTLYREVIYIKKISSGTPDIYITMDSSIEEDVVAYAAIPSGGKPGSTIRINPSYNWCLSDVKKNIIVHELGHNLGLVHTDYLSTGESENYIFGTPLYDSESVMHHSVGAWNGFSDGDIAAIHILYGEPVYDAYIDAGNLALKSTYYTYSLQHSTYCHNVQYYWYGDNIYVSAGQGTPIANLAFNALGSNSLNVRVVVPGANREYTFTKNITVNSSLTSLPTPVITGSHTSALPSTVVSLNATCNTTLPVSYEWTVSNGQIIYSYGSNIKVSSFSWPPILSTVKCRVKCDDFVSEWGTYDISILRSVPPGDGPCVICGSTGICDCETIIILD